MGNKSKMITQIPCTSRPSFREAFRRAAEQTELNVFADREKDERRELCYIIAEAYITPRENDMLINGEVISAEVVQEVFAELRAEHLGMVLQHFREMKHLVKNKRLYLRAALYNAVFELEADATNRTTVAMNGGGDQ